MAYFPPCIDATGIHLPTYEDRLQDLCSAYRTVFGQQAGLSPAVEPEMLDRQRRGCRTGARGRR